MMPFQLTLPEHLPHCVHLPNIKLEYRLIATLHPSASRPQRMPLRKAVLVHVTRYSPPSPVHELVSPQLAQDFSLKGRSWQLTKPTAVDVHLSSTLVRRAEHLKVKVKIPCPNEKALGKGLRIRSVEAELVRVVKVQPSDEEEGSPGKSREKGKASERAYHDGSPELSRQINAVHDHHHRATEDGWEPHASLLYNDEQPNRPATATSAATSSPTIQLRGLPSPQGIPPPPFEEQQSQVSAALQEAPPAFASHQGSSIANDEAAETLSDSSEEGPSAFETVLSHTGKSCRFSLRRPLVLHLTLRPPFNSPTLPHPSPDHDAPPAGVSPLRPGTTGGGGGCESISMSTGLIQVEFKVKITIRLRGGSEESQHQEAGASSGSVGRTRTTANASRDIVVEQTIHVMPGVAGGVVPAADEQDAATRNIDGVPASSDDDFFSEEEFDGYEDFRDVHDSFSDPVSDDPQFPASSNRSSARGPAPPSFDSSQTPPSLTVNGNPAYSTVRAADDGDDLPPNHEQSQHDLQIFPTHVIELPDEESDGTDHQDALPSGSPPAFQDDSAGQQEIIEGVGHGERRRAPAYADAPAAGLASWQHGQLGSMIGRAHSPPPNFETSSASRPSEAAETLTQPQQGILIEPPPYAQPSRRPPAVKAPSYAEQAVGQASASSSRPISPPPQLDQGGSSRAGASPALFDPQNGSYMSAEQEKAMLAEAARREAEMDGTTSTSEATAGQAHLPPAYGSHLSQEDQTQDRQGSEEIEGSSLLPGQGQDEEEQSVNEVATALQRATTADEPPVYEA